MNRFGSHFVLGSISNTSESTRLNSTGLKNRQKSFSDVLLILPISITVTDKTDVTHVTRSNSKTQFDLVGDISFVRHCIIPTLFVQAWQEKLASDAVHKCTLCRIRLLVPSVA
jgi:hypothetical protein